MEPERRNWVAERAKCDMASLFSDMKTCVEQDVGDMNTEADTRNWTQRFTFRPEAKAAAVFGVDGPQGCQFEYRSKTDDIIVRMLTRDSIVKTEWDAKTIQCRIVVADTNGTPLAEFPHADLWKAVQYLLEPLFFPPG